MGKKIRFQHLSGSLYKPSFRYTQKLQIFYNPVSDPKGSKLAKHFYQMGAQSYPQYKVPNFECTMVQDYKSPTSYLIADFINGWKHGLYLKDSNKDEIDFTFHEINQLIQFERTLQGHDDQYEDDV